MGEATAAWALLIVTVILLFGNLVYYAVHIREDFARGVPERAIMGLVTVVGLNLILIFVVYHEASRDLVL